MDTESILEIKSDLINELRGQVAARGYYDVEAKTRFMYIFRGMDKPYEKVTMTCDQEFALIEMEDTYFRAPASRLLISAGDCELFVDCGDACDNARNLSIDDLMNLRDLVCSMTDEAIRECKEYMESEDRYNDEN